MKRSFVRTVASLLTGFVLIATFGCGGRVGYPASGKVLVNGQPVAGAIVVLSRADGADALERKPNGVTREDGTFQLNTETESDGVPAGEYKVSITWPGKAKPSSAPKGLGGGDDEKAIASDQLRGKYGDPNTSGIKATIRSGSNELPAFELSNR